MAVRKAFLLALIAFVGCDRDPGDPADSIQLHHTAAGDTVAIGDSLRLQARSALTGASITAPITWSSSDTLVGVVDATGLVRARQPGAVVITAHSASMTGSIKLTTKIFAAGVCSGARRVHSGTISGATWTAADGPYFLSGELLVAGTLTVQAGAVVCAAEAGGIKTMPGGSFVALGAGVETILFTAADPQRGWRGIDADQGNAHLRRVRIEYASTAVRGFGCRVTIDSIHVRQSGNGISVVDPCPLVVRNSVFDTIAGAAIMNRVPGAENFAQSNLDVVVEDNVIHKAARGIFLDGWNGSATVSGGRIEDAIVAFSLESVNSRNMPDGVRVTSARPIRILRADTSVASSIEAFSKIWPVQHRDSLRGNRGDTVYLEGGYTGTLHVSRGVPVVRVLKAGARIPWAGPINSITIEPGGVLRIRDRAQVGLLIAEGTAQQPITIEGGWFEAGDSAQRSRLRHVRLSFADAPAGMVNVTGDSLEVRGNSRLSFGVYRATLADVLFETFTDLSVGDSSTLRRVTVRGMTGGLNIVGSNVHVSECSIVDNQGTAIDVFREVDVHVNDCNIERNGEFTVSNGTSAVFDARRNWWGRPTGPRPEEILGPVDYSQFRTSPVGGATRVTSLALDRADATVATSDTVRFRIIAQDASGTLIPNASILCRSANDAVAICDPRTGLIAGIRPGNTRVEFIAASDTTVRASANVSVIAGAPVYSWTRYAHFAGRWRYPLTVWGFNTSDVYVSGNVLHVHFDGNSWREIPEWNSFFFWQLVGGPNRSLYAVEGGNSAARRVMRMQNGTWEPVGVPSGNQCRVSVGRDGSVVVGSTFNFVQAPVDTVWIQTGDAWQPRAPGIRACDAWHRSPSQVFAVQDSIVMEWNGATWTRHRATSVFSLNSGVALNPKHVWDSGSYAYGINYAGPVGRFANGLWEAMPGAPGGRAIFGLSDNEVYTAGGSGSFALWDGQTWRSLYTGTTDNFTDMWVSGLDVFLVSSAGIIYHGRRL